MSLRCWPPERATVEAAARHWVAGGLVGMPTETVYGLAARADDPHAVARIYAAKGREAVKHDMMNAEASKIERCDQGG